MCTVFYVKGKKKRKKKRKNACCCVQHGSPVHLHDIPGHLEQQRRAAHRGHRAPGVLQREGGRYAGLPVLLALPLW